MSQYERFDTPFLPVGHAELSLGKVRDLEAFLPASEVAYKRLARARGKRLADFVLALLALVFLSPLILFVAVAIRLSSPGRVFYSHTRIGRNGERFGCLKFRTMVMNGDAVLREHLDRDPAAAAEWALTRKLRDDPRITPIGAMLRSTSLDELPQLVNILRGEMSIVGPRPIVEDELVRYGPHVGAYLAARPGLTGLWQVSGRSDVAYEERVRLDREYVESWTMRSDFVLMLRTVPVVLSRRGSC